MAAPLAVQTQVELLGDADRDSVRAKVAADVLSAADAATADKSADNTLNLPGLQGLLADVYGEPTNDDSDKSAEPVSDAE